MSNIQRPILTRIQELSNNEFALVLDDLLQPVSGFEYLHQYDPPVGNVSWMEVKKEQINKKTIADKFKQHLFLAVWDSFIGLVTSSSFNGKKNQSFTGLISKLLSRVVRKMGTSIYELVDANTNHQDKNNYHICLSLLLLLIGSQFLIKKVQK